MKLKTIITNSVKTSMFKYEKKVKKRYVKSEEMVRENLLENVIKSNKNHGYITIIIMSCKF